MLTLFSFNCKRQNENKADGTVNKDRDLLNLLV